MPPPLTHRQPAPLGCQALGGGEGRGGGCSGPQSIVGGAAAGAAGRTWVKEEGPAVHLGLLCPGVLSGSPANTHFCDQSCAGGWDSERKDTHDPHPQGAHGAAGEMPQ